MSRNTKTETQPVRRAAQNRAAALLLLTAIIWGVAFVAQRLAMDYMGPLIFTGSRFLLGSVSLLPVIFFFERKTQFPLKGTLAAGAICGLVLFTAAALQQVGVQITESAGKSGFITGLYIVLTPILGIFLGKKTRFPAWIGALLACAGLYLLSAASGISSIGLGDITLLLCAFFWSVHILTIDHFAGRIDSLRFAAAQFAVCGILSTAAAFLFEPVSLHSLWAGSAPILYSGLLSVGVAYTLQIIGQRHVEPSAAALIFSMESLFAALAGALFLAEVMTGRAYIGCGMIFAGIIISSQLKLKRRSL